MTDWDLPSGVTLRNVHDESGCVGACVIHRPTRHHMSEWSLVWRDDRGIFERICEHGIGHPDPDQLDYWKRTRQEWQSVHGCDGCCQSKDVA